MPPCANPHYRPLALLASLAVAALAGCTDVGNGTGKAIRNIPVQLSLNDSYESAVPQLYRDNIRNYSASINSTEQSLALEFDYQSRNSFTKFILILRDAQDVRLATTGTVALTHMENLHGAQVLQGYDSTLVSNSEVNKLSWNFRKSDLDEAAYVQLYVSRVQ